MPILSQVIDKLSKDLNIQFILPLAENITEAYVMSFLPAPTDNPKILQQDAYEALAHSDMALSSCGTANLEAALLGTPAVAFYRVSPLTYFAGIKLMKIKNFSIVNILAGKKIIPELIQRNFTVANILEETRNILESETKQSLIKAEYGEIRLLLGEKIASENTAQELERLLKNQKNSNV